MPILRKKVEIELEFAEYLVIQLCRATTVSGQKSILEAAEKLQAEIDDQFG